MKGWNILFLILILAIVGGLIFFSLSRKKGGVTANPPNLNISTKKTMKISSPVFQNNGNIPPKYTCDGENASPPLEISDVPAEAQSLALVLHDPDAPLAEGFTHWVVWNIDPAVKDIPENSSPDGAIQGTTSSGRTGYTGPCPPSGTHHYEFRLYALDTKFDLDSSAKKDDLEKAMEGHTVEQTLLTGLYQRQ